MTAKHDEQLNRLKQLTRFMEEHNILKLKTGEFQIERGRPEEASDPTREKELDQNMRAEAQRLADIRLNCPYPCPHWGREGRTRRGN